MGTQANGDVIASVNPELHDLAWMLDSLRRRQRRSKGQKARYEGVRSECATAFLQAGIQAWVIYDLNKVEVDGTSTFSGKARLRTQMRKLEQLESTEVTKLAVALLHSIKNDADVSEKVHAYAKHIEASQSTSRQNRVKDLAADRSHNTEAEMQHHDARSTNPFNGFDVSCGVPRSKASSLFTKEFLSKVSLTFDKETGTGEGPLAIGMTLFEEQLKWGCLMTIAVQPKYLSELALKLANVKLLDVGGVRYIEHGNSRILPNKKLTIDCLELEVLQRYCHEDILQACQPRGSGTPANIGLSQNASLIIPTRSRDAGELNFVMKSLPGTRLKELLFAPVNKA
ncbi:hypothetical protein IF2G_11062 [Cordyceps javanica]|nr:hypothetical protein IF2G_11062 [Cordyceps javanica]